MIKRLIDFLKLRPRQVSEQTWPFPQTTVQPTPTETTSSGTEDIRNVVVTSSEPTKSEPIVETPVQPPADLRPTKAVTQQLKSGPSPKKATSAKTRTKRKG